MASTTFTPPNNTLPRLPRRNVHSKLAGVVIFRRPSFSFPSTSQESFPTLSTSFTTPASRRQVSCSVSASEQAQKASPSPPTSKEEAIEQARTCLANALARPLSNVAVAGKFKKQRQLRLRLEIPVFDDSPESLSRLALDVLSRLPAVKRRQPVVLLIWPTTQLSTLAAGGAGDSSSSVISSNLKSLNEIRPAVASADVVVFFSPASSQLSSVKEICEAFQPKPAVLFNPGWGYEEEDELGSEVSSFVKSFEVVYSFMGLEVRGVLSKKRGVVFRCVKDGVAGPPAGEGWDVLMEGDGGEMKVVTRFKKRPAIGEVENVLYNVMAMNSPITKTVKFFKNLVSSSNDQDDKKKKK